MDLSELEFRAESCRRVADNLLNPDVIRELRAMAQKYEALAAQLRGEPERRRPDRNRPRIRSRRSGPVRR